jgi:hypothetical protein
MRLFVVALAGADEHENLSLGYGEPLLFVRAVDREAAVSLAQQALKKSNVKYYEPVLHRLAVRELSQEGAGEVLLFASGAD